MPTFATVLGGLVALWLLTYLFKLIRNLYYAFRSGVPWVFLPWDQNGVVWMIVSVPLRPVLAKIFPTWLFKRTCLLIYGWEFHDQLRPFEEYAAPQGNDKTFFLVTAGLPEISTRDPEVAWQIVSRPNDFRQPPLISAFVAKFGVNLLTSNGQQWSRQRKIIAGVINERVSKVIFNESTKQTGGMLEEVFEKTEGGVAETTQVFNMMKRITIQVLAGGAMGQEVTWKDNPNDKPRPGFKMTYMQATATVIEAIAGPIILPIWFLKSYPSFLPGYAFLKELGIAIEEFPLHTNHLMQQETERAAREGGQARSNIASQLLRANQGDGKSSLSLTDEELLGNLFVVSAAGFDTTANTLSYALVMLCRYPEIQDWVLEEIDELLSDSMGDELDYAAIFPKVVRVMSVMLEVLRLFVPVIHLAKATETAQIIETSAGKLSIPPMCTMYIDVVALHLDPIVWRDLNKSDTESGKTGSYSELGTAIKADEFNFRPKRWINPAGSSQPLFQPPRGYYMPWSAGPRVCPGQRMAQVEFTAIFLTLFRRHRIEAVPLTIDGRQETLAEKNARLDAIMKDSVSILTLQMKGIYDAVDGTWGASDSNGINVRISKRN